MDQNRLSSIQAIILCGGKGTRLSALYSDRPKILVPVAGRPLLAWQLEGRGRAGSTDIVFSAGYTAEVLAAYVTGVGSSLSTEPSPLGTGGGLKFVEPWIRSDPFLVLNGDSLSPKLDFVKLLKVHQDRPPSDATEARARGTVTIAVTRIEESGRYGTVEFNDAGLVTAFREKAQRESGWINAGVYLVDRAVLASIPPGGSLSLETDLFPELVGRGQVRACPIAPPMLDMGTPEGIRAMEEDLSNRLPLRSQPEGVPRLRGSSLRR